MKRTQIDEVLKYLQTHPKGITSKQAFEMFGSTRLSSIIYHLRHDYGYNIESEYISVKTRYGGKVMVSCYKLIG